jgi:outer membrane protein assembly factor BamB
MLVAVDLDRGRERWRVDLESTVAPAAGEGRVFAVADGVLVALDAESGRLLWRTPIPGRVAAPLHWETGWLVLSTDAGDLSAFRAADGSFVWRQTLGAPLALAPAPALDRLFCALTDGRVLSLDLATGTLRWEEKVEGRVSGVTVIGDQLVVGTTGNAVHSFDLARGRSRWRWRVGADVVGGAAADERHIYFVALDNVVRAVDRRSANLRWTRPVASRAGSGPIRLADVLLVPFVSNEILALSPADGKVLWTLQLADELSGPPHLRAAASPTSARLITIGRDGTLVGLAPRLEPAPAPIQALPGAAVIP